MIHKTLLLLSAGFSLASGNLSAMDAKQKIQILHRRSQSLGQLEPRPVQMTDHFDKVAFKKKFESMIATHEAEDKQELEDRQRCVCCFGTVFCGAMALVGVYLAANNHTLQGQ